MFSHVKVLVSQLLTDTSSGHAMKKKSDYEVGMRNSSAHFMRNPKCLRMITECKGTTQNVQFQT